MSKKILCAIAMGMMCLGAQSAWATGQSISGLSISRLATGWGAEGFYVNTTETLTSVDGCSSNAMIISPDHPLLKIMVSMLLTAKLTNAKIDVYVDGCSGQTLVLKAVSLSN